FSSSPSPPSPFISVSSRFIPQISAKPIDNVPRAYTYFQMLVNAITEAFVACWFLSATVAAVPRLFDNTNDALRHHGNFADNRPHHFVEPANARSDEPPTEEQLRKLEPPDCADYCIDDPEPSVHLFTRGPMTFTRERVTFTREPVTFTREPLTRMLTVTTTTTMATSTTLATK
ncbi:hypothetical protein TCAP_03151, partial [Tolypocladium capitatum]